jgi:hypothetical protein
MDYSTERTEAMALDQVDVVDYIGQDRADDDIVLVICDHFPWDDGEEEDFNHMDLLQQKIYRYLDFIESGEINEAYPQAVGRKARLLVAAKYEMNKEGAAFFKRIQNGLSEEGYKLEFRHFPRD